MKISILGSGYVGTTTALCLSELGHETLNIDIDEGIVNSLNNGELHIHEDGLNKLLNKHLKKNFKASTSYLDVLDTDITFLCLPTPSNKSGSIDLSIMKKGVKKLGNVLESKNEEHMVVMKSTVIPGSTNEIGKVISKKSNKELGEDLYIGSNPEFLREGSALKDFMEPDKLVIGGNKKPINILKKVYENLIPRTTLFETSIKTAEIIKYVNNSLLATKISFANEIGNICKELDIDTYEVMDAVGLDHRIERKFLNSGIGFGGSCFPKDVRAIRNKAEKIGVNPKILKAVLNVNQKQPIKVVDLLERKIGDLNNKKVALLGVAFKPGTDDIRNSRSIPVIEELNKRGSEIIIHDPKAIKNMKKLFPKLKYVDKPKKALKRSDACLILTGWPQYKELEIDIPCIEGRKLDKGEGICW